MINKPMTTTADSDHHHGWRVSGVSWTVIVSVKDTVLTFMTPKIFNRVLQYIFVAEWFSFSIQIGSGMRLLNGKTFPESVKKVLKNII